MNNKHFRFFHISDKYIRFLSSGDNRVQHNKEKRRPYVGVVIEVSGLDYYVPLESPKPNHARIKSNGPVLKLQNGTLGIMGFNNMIPVHKSALIAFDFADVDDKYRALLINQLNYCNKNRELILRRAELTYVKATEKNIPYYKNVCCNFKKLENMCRNYDPNYRRKK